MPLKCHMILVTWFSSSKVFNRWKMTDLKIGAYHVAILLNFIFFLIDEISRKYWNLDWWISIEVIFAKVEFWYRKLRSLNCIKFTFWNFLRNFWGWMLKPLLIGSNSLCDFQENSFGTAVFSPDLLVCRDSRTKTDWSRTSDWVVRLVYGGSVRFYPLVHGSLLV